MPILSQFHRFWNLLLLIVKDNDPYHALEMVGRDILIAPPLLELGANPLLCF